MYLNVQNPDNLDKAMLDLSGGYRIFAPDKDGVFFDATGKKPIHMGHVSNPAETYTPTEVPVTTGVYGRLQTVDTFVTQTVESGTFETASVKNARIRGLHAGSPTYDGTTPAATPFAVSTAVSLGDFIVPATPNGRYYEVTTAGTTGNAAPTWPTTTGTTVTSGGAVLTDRGLVVTGGLIIIPRNHASIPGMLIDVIESAVGRTSELFVQPSVTLRGDGRASGGDSTNPTRLKFAYTINAATGYVIPTTLGAFTTVPVQGGYEVLNLPHADINSTIDKIVAAFYT